MNDEPLEPNCVTCPDCGNTSIDSIVDLLEIARMGERGSYWASVFEVRKALERIVPTVPHIAALSAGELEALATSEAPFWRTPMADEAGARVETLFTKDGQPARPGERAYRRQPNGELVLQSQTIGQQVEMMERISPTTAPAQMSDLVNRPQRLKALGNGVVPSVAFVMGSAVAAVLEAYD